MNSAFARDYLYPKTRLMIHQVMYSGEKGKSFAETGIGYGISLSVFADGNFLSPYFSIQGASLKNNQIFLDGPNEVKSSFIYYYGAAEPGIQYYVIPRRKTGANVYISGSGIIGYNYVALEKNLSLSHISNTDQSFSLGYATGIGTEYVFSSNPKSRWALIGQIQYRQEKAQLLKTNFDISSLNLSVGASW